MNDFVAVPFGCDDGSIPQFSIRFVFHRDAGNRAGSCRENFAQLGGRVFHYNYYHHTETGDATLELIMVVANWINDFLSDFTRSGQALEIKHRIEVTTV